MAMLFNLGEPTPSQRPAEPARRALFKDGFSRANIRLRLSKEQWKAVEAMAEAEGRSFREFLKVRLLRSIGFLE
jgi:hypothetical protein